MFTDDEISLVTTLIRTYVGGFMFVFGTIGNIMNVLAFCSLKDYRTLPTSAFLAASSITDQIYITFTIFISSLSTILSYNPTAVNMVFCKFALFITAASTRIALTCLCLSTIDRYLMTSRSARLRTLLNLRRAYLTICLSTLVWLCYAVPNAIYTLNIPSYNLYAPSVDFLTTSAYLNLVFAILLPISIMSVFGLLTWKNLGRMRQSSLNLQVAKMILLNVIVVAISNIPLGCVFLYDIAISLAQLFVPSTFLAFTITQLLSTVQSCGSFYLYLIISPTFRKNIRQLILRMCCFWNPQMQNRVAPQAMIGDTSARRVMETAT